VCKSEKKIRRHWGHIHKDRSPLLHRKRQNQKGKRKILKGEICRKNHQYNHPKMPKSVVCGNIGREGKKPEGLKKSHW